MSKKIIKLENELLGVKNEINALKRRVQLLEFKEEANGNQYVFKELACYGGIAVRFIKCYWNNSGKICESVIGYELGGIKTNGKYIECFYGKTLKSVLFADGDNLVKIDIETYKKAYPERFIQEEETEEKKND